MYILVDFFPSVTIQYVGGIQLFFCANPGWPLSSGLNVDDLRERTIKFFGPGTEYDTPLNNPYREKGGMLESILSVFFAKHWFVLYSDLVILKWRVDINGNFWPLCKYLMLRKGPRPPLPIDGPWRHGSLKGFLKNVDAGKEETGESAARLSEKQKQQHLICNN